MRNSTIIYGYINCTRYAGEHRSWGYNARLNKHLVKSYLPRTSADDDWPYLTQQIISFSTLDYYDEHITHLGVTLTNLHFLAWAYWVQKFEELLCRLCWLDAKIHAHGEPQYPACTWYNRNTGIQLGTNEVCPTPDWEVIGNNPADTVRQLYRDVHGDFEAICAQLESSGDRETDRKMITRICCRERWGVGR